MADRIDQRAAIASALGEFESQSLADAAKRLFATLGYKSVRKIPIATPRQFCEHLDPGGKLTDRERESLETLQSLSLLFQFSIRTISMLQSLTRIAGPIPSLLVILATSVAAQHPPYDVFPAAEPPYYRVRYEASTQPGELVYPVNYTVWIPGGVKSLRGVIVHQHGCGEGSCKSGLTGAYDLHWQALAKKHDCALLAPSYEQPGKADCQMWCDPRNGSDAAFQKCLVDLGEKSGHPELDTVPWALWGHSGGGHWAGGMVLLHPERVAAAWLRSGVPLLNRIRRVPRSRLTPCPTLRSRCP